jgi:ribosome maturation factor RimP
MQNKTNQIEKIRKKSKLGLKSEKTRITPELEKKILKLTWDFVEPLCESEGMELVDVEFQRESGGRVLRLYIDRPGGVVLDDCVDISRQVNDLLDVNLEFEGTYTLEVSSPGIPRRIGKLSDFQKFTGERVRMKTKKPVLGKKNFQATLMGAKDDTIIVSIDEQTTNISLEDITKAHLME